MAQKVKIVFPFALLIIFFSIPVVFGAVSGISGSEPYYPEKREMGIHPSKGSASVNNEITVELVAYPQNPANREDMTLNQFSRFTFEIAFDPGFFRYVSAEPAVGADYGISVPGQMAVPVINEINGPNGKKILSYTQEYVGFPSPVNSRQTALVEVTFLPLRAGTSTIELKDAFINVPGGSGANAIDNTKLSSLQLTVAEGTALSGGDGTCTPRCLKDKSECGPNGCGGSCGECEEEKVCKQGKCVCLPACGGKNCGGDNCGGSCGECPGGQVCSSGGICVAAGTAQQLAAGGGRTGEEAEPAVQEPESLNIYLLAGGIVMVLAAVVGGIILYAHKPESPQL